MNQTLSTCPHCSTDQCEQCQRPDHRDRETASGASVPTCCCGRRFRPGAAKSTPRLAEMRAMIRQDQLEPETPVEKRIAAHILDSLTLEGLEAFAAMLHRLGVRAMEGGQKEAELTIYDLGYEAGTRNADNDLAHGVHDDLEPAVEDLKAAIETVRRCLDQHQSQQEERQVVEEGTPERPTS